MTQEERITDIRLRLSELSAQTSIPEGVKLSWRNKILKKASKWDITLAEFAEPAKPTAAACDMDENGQGGHLVVEDDGTKHLPTTKNGKPDHGLMGAAHAALHSGFRGNKYSGPKKGEAIGKLKALYKSEKMDWPADKTAADEGPKIDYRKEFSARLDARCFELSEPTVDRFGRKAYRIPVALTGEWIKDKPFGITREDLARMRDNLNKRGNGEIVVDYEHASEDPGVAAGGPVPAAGWASSPEVRDLGDRSILTALFAPNPRAEEMIRKGEYRYLSPALDKAFKDKTTGEPQGATLTSIALTNKPFLEDLPHLQLHEVYWSPTAVLMTELQGGKSMTKLEQVEEMRTRAEALAKEGKAAESATLLSEAESLEAAEMKCADGAPRLRLRKLTDGPNKGKVGIFGGDGKQVGYLTDGDMARMSGAKDDDDDDDADDKKKLHEALATFREMGMEKLALTDIKSLVEKGRAAIAAEAAGDGKKVLMSEAVVNGCLDRTKAGFVANTHRNVTTADFIAVERADSILAEAVRAGKCTPAHRKELFTDVMADPEKWTKMLKDAVPLFNVSRGTGNPGGEEPLKASDEINELVKARREKNPKEDYGDALRVVLSEHRELAEKRDHELKANRA